MAAIEIFANQPTTTVSSGGTTAPSPGTVESWTVASSSSFPAASNSATPPTQFHVCDTASGSQSEIIAVTNVSGTTWTVTRGAESTTPVAHSAGFTIVQVTTAGWLGSGVVYAAGGGREQIQALGSLSSTGTVNLVNGNVFTATLAGNVTFTFTGAANNLACSFTLLLTQDGTGGRSATWPGSVTWLGGVAPVLASAPAGLTVLVFETLNGGTTWYGSLAGNAPSLPQIVADGGTGAASLAAFAVLTGGTTATSQVQQVSGTGTSGQVLASQGAAAVPAWATAAPAPAGQVVQRIFFA